MKKGLIVVLIIAIITALASAASPKVLTPNPPANIPTSIKEITDSDSINLSFNNKSVTLEVARSYNKRQEGLMNRTSLEKNHGMIFIFDKEDPLTFWMMNTLISLDIIYLNKDLQVVSIAKSTKPNQTSEVYPSYAPAQFVIELNGGWSDENNLKIGDTFKHLP